MAAPLPLDLRERLVAATEQFDLTLRTTAEIFQVGTATLKRLRRRKREKGTLTPEPRRNGPVPKRTPERLELLRRLVESAPDAFLRELAEAWTEACAPEGPLMNPVDVFRGLKELGISRKKSA